MKRADNRDFAGRTAPAAALVEEPEQPVHKWAVTAAVMLGAILQTLDISIVNVALPYMRNSFGVSVDKTTWVVTSYLVAVSIMLPLTGWLAARIGRKVYLMVSVLSFMISSAMCGLAGTIGVMVVSRAVQGAAGAAMLPLAQAILLETFPPAEHTLAMTTFGIGMMAAPVLGPTLGGWITLNWNWRWNFYINLPVAALALVMIYLFVHDPHYLRKRRGQGRIDYVGIILVTLSLGLFEIVLGRGGYSGWFAAAWVRWFIAISGLSAVALIIHEVRFSEPIIDLRLLLSLTFTLSVVIISLQALAIYSVNLLNPLFMETVLGYDAWKAGIAVAPRGLGVIVALVAVGQLSRRGVDMRPIIAGGLLLGAYEVWRMAHWELNVSMSGMMWPIFFFGLGLGVVFPTIAAIGVGQVARERMGFAASLFSMMINAGAATGIAAVSNLLTARHQLYRTMVVTRAVRPGEGGLIGEAVMAARAWLPAYHDVYRILAVLVLVLVPLVFMLKKPEVHVGAEVVLE